MFLLIPRWRSYGALLGLVLMTGAISFHLTALGIEVQEDGGQLFYYALAVFMSCSIILILRRKEMNLLKKKA